MSKSYPETIPAAYRRGKNLRRAYELGWNHGHGIACHNVPTLGERIWVEDLGHVTVDAENIREVHQSECFAAESHSRCYSPFEFTAAEFNGARNAEQLWEAFEQGAADSIFADLAEYTDADYGIEDEEEDDDEDAIARQEAEALGWTETPVGRWWREIQDGETHDAERLEMFLGSGPFVMADSAQDALDYDAAADERAERFAAQQAQLSLALEQQ